MSTQPGNPTASQEQAQVDEAMILYVLHSYGFYPAIASIADHWGTVMDWWHNLKSVEWLEQQTGWTCTLKGTKTERGKERGTRT